MWVRYDLASRLINVFVIIGIQGNCGALKFSLEKYIKRPDCWSINVNFQDKLIWDNSSMHGMWGPFIEAWYGLHVDDVCLSVN